MHRLITTVLVASSLSATTLAAAPSGPVPSFGGTTTITTSSDATTRLELDVDAVLLTDPEARINGQPVVDVQGGHAKLAGLLIAPVIGGRAQWATNTLRIVRHHDEPTPTVEVVRDHTEEHPEDDLGIQLHRGTYEVIALAGDQPMAATVRLVRLDAAALIDDRTVQVKASGPAEVVRHDVDPNLAEPEPDASVAWGGGITYDSGPGGTLSLGVFRAEVQVDVTNVHYSFSPCDFTGEPGLPGFAPGCANVVVGQGQGGGFHIGVLRPDDQGRTVGYWLIDGFAANQTRSLGVGFAASRPAATDLHIVQVALAPSA